MSHLEAWKAYALARIEKEDAADFLKQVSGRFYAAEKALLEAMIEDEVRGIPDACGANVGLSRQWAIRCNVHNKDDVEQWLQDQYGDVELYRTSVLDKPAITARIQEDCEDEKCGLTEDTLPEFFDLKTHPKVVVRGWASKKAQILEGPNE